MPAKNISGESDPIFDLGLQQIPFSKSVDSKMRTLLSRTQITPNILSRLGFCLSIEEPGIPPDPFESEERGRVINRGTLLGEHDFIFVALLRTWIQRNIYGDPVDQARFDALFVAHMNRGFELISARIRSISDLSNLLGRMPG